MESAQPSNARMLSLTAGVGARNWMNFVGVLWMQALTGTNFDFSAYSSSLKQVLKISQVQLNNLAVASDLGKTLGWISGYALRHMPLWAALSIASLMGLVGYGIQWLIMIEKISSNYWQVYILCLMAGNSICWFNTICFIPCLRNFPIRRALALGLSTSYNGLTAAIFTLIVKAITLNTESLYLLLNSVFPLIISCITVNFLPKYLSSVKVASQGEAGGERVIFISLNILSIVLGLYLLPSEFISLTSTSSYKIYAAGMVLLLVAPLTVPGTMYIRGLRGNTEVMGLHSNDHDGLGKPFLTIDEGIYQENYETESGHEEHGISEVDNNSEIYTNCCNASKICFWFQTSLPRLGEEHNLPQLIQTVDFWVYFLMYFCSATLGLVYSNNLGQIAQSRGHSNATVFVSLYSSFSFFGRLMSAAPDYFPRAMRVPRPGWMLLALLPMAPAFFFLATGISASLYVSTAIIGMSSGFIISTAVSITSELFGLNSFGVNHNIVISNIPLGSLLFGYMAAEIYDKNAQGGNEFEKNVGRMVVCMGGKCYRTTFVIWGCISLAGLLLNCIIILRTRRLYDTLYKSKEEKGGSSNEG